MSPRIPLLTDRRLDIGLADASGLAPELDALRRRVRTDVPVGALDPVTAELVRLQNARHQGCNLCQGLRYSSAVASGATEAVLAPDAPDRRADQLAALELADAFLGRPGDLSDADRDRIARDLTAEQAVEVVGRLANWTFNKVLISLGLDVDEIVVREYPG